jgi:hypothetical protein
MATLTAEQFRKMFPQANNEPVTRALGRGLQAIADPLNQYRLPESMPVVGGMSAADFTGLTGAQGVLQDFSKGNLQSGDMRMFDLLGVGAGAAPAARTALKGGGLLGKEALRQMNEGTGLLGLITPNPRQYMIETKYGKIPENWEDVEFLSKQIEDAALKQGYNVVSDKSQVSPSQYITIGKEGLPEQQIRISNHLDKYPELAPTSEGSKRFSIDPSSGNTYEESIDWLNQQGYPLELEGVGYVPSELDMQKATNLIKQKQIQKIASSYEPTYKDFRITSTKINSGGKRYDVMNRAGEIKSFYSKNIPEKIKNNPDRNVLYQYITNNL